MYALLLYSLKAGACLAVFYLFFKLLMSRDTFHRFNRLLVMGAVVLSFVLPLCVITVYRELPVVLQSGDVELPAAVELPPAEASSPWEMLAGVLFLAGAVVTLALTLRSLLGVLRIIRTGRRERLADGVTVVYVSRPMVPFSWGRYVVLPEEDQQEDSRQIVLHELAHVRLHHSLDLVVADLAGCLQWFNPAMWLLRRELRAIHEYEADRAVLDSGADAKQYQLLLIKKAAGGKWYSVANSFNHSKLKNRIAMMLQEKSSRWAGAKALLVVPLAGLALGAFAQTAYVFPEEKRENISISVSGSNVSMKGIAGKPLLVVNGRVADSLPAPTGVHRTMKFVRDSSMLAAYGEKARDGVLYVEDRMSETGDGLADGAASATSFVVTQTPQGMQVVGSKSGNVDVQMRTTGAQTPDPLFVVDGKQLSGVSINTISPDQIESISVLKDKIAVDKYGEKGRRGVIEITTKAMAAALKAARSGVEAGRKALDAARGVMNSEEWSEAKEQLDDAMERLGQVTREADVPQEETSRADSQPVVESTPKGQRTGITTGLGQTKVERQEGVTIYKGRIMLTDYPEQMLVFINGKQTSRAEVMQLAPKVIKRMEELGGATAVAKYGERGRHGVIEITTRK